MITTQWQVYNTVANIGMGLDGIDYEVLHKT
jgi:hypothetical protein